MNAWFAARSMMLEKQAKIQQIRWFFLARLQRLGYKAPASTGPDSCIADTALSTTQQFGKKPGNNQLRSRTGQTTKFLLNLPIYTFEGTH